MTEADDVPAAIPTKRRPSFLWLVPIVATLLLAYVGYTTLARRGPLVTLTFHTADGLVAGETQVRFRAVTLGTVESVELSGDKTHVVARVRMTREAKSMLTDHARFWVVRPRFAQGSVSGFASGLETLVSGAYIAVDPGPPGGKPTKAFTGLEEPPGIRSDDPGKTFVLQADRLGSLSTGSTVFYRDVGVGEVLSYDLGDGSAPVAIRVLIRAPFDAMVHADTRFWNASGVTLAMGAEGLRVEVESIQSALSGAIEFETTSTSDTPPSPEGTTFHLFGDKAKADTAMYQARIPCVTYLRGSVQGLSHATPVSLYGVTIGAVTDVRLVTNPKGDILARVAFDVQPGRGLAAADVASETPDAALRRLLANPKLHVVVASESFVTGQKALALSLRDGAKKKPQGREGDVYVVEGEAGGLDAITTSLAEVASKLNEIPFAAIGTDLDAAIKNVNTNFGGPEMRDTIESLASAMADVKNVAREADAGMTPALRRLPAIATRLEAAAEKANAAFGDQGYGASSDFQRGMKRMMDQVAETARSVRLLAEFLDRHPEALVRGRTAGANRR